MSWNGSSTRVFAVVLVAGMIGAIVCVYVFVRPKESTPPAPYLAPQIKSPEPVSESKVSETVPEVPGAGETAKGAKDIDSTAPATFLKLVVRDIATGDSESLTKLLEEGVGDPERLDRFGMAIRERRLTIDGTSPLSEIEPLEDETHCWAVNLIHQPSGERDALVLTIRYDFEEGKWRIQEVVVPTVPEEPAKAIEPEREIAETAVVARANEFLGALRGGNYGRARDLAAEHDVPNEKLAALGILLDEGGFTPIEEKGLLVTSIGDDTAWVLTRVASEAFGVQSEFGLEMARQTDGSWQIKGVNFSRLMNEFARMDRSGETPQAPLVETPRGGESIALYFTYDEDELSPKSMRQLSIVAGILKAGADRAITVSGHADALGDETYNEGLAARRAQRVAAALESFGVRRGQILTKSFGESQPLQPNARPDGSDNPEGRSRNRRAEIYLDF